MINGLVKQLKENWIYFLLISLFILVAGYYISIFSREEGHVILNGYHAPFFDHFFYYLTYVGDGITAIVIAILLFLWKEKYGYTALFAFLFTAGITHGLKFLVYADIERPILALWDHFHYGNGHHVIPLDEMKKGNSFPSGHTTSAMSIFCILALISHKRWKWSGFIFAALAILASSSRVYLSEHFAEDVFAGSIIGNFGSLFIFVWLYPKFDQDRFQQKISSKRVLDLFFSLLVFVIGLPFFMVISLLVLTTGKGGIFFKQERIGLNGKKFYLYKFRTMRPNSEIKGQITVGGKDPRITRIGYFLRKFKLDEFPQIINILKGDMSVVGPRPEVKKYVDLYNEDQLKVLSVLPGLTDYASIEYMDENEILGKAEDPEKSYIEEVMPHKLSLNLKYISEKSFLVDLKIIWRTFIGIFR